MSAVLGLYQPGTTLLHRLSAGTKLLGLAAVSVAVVVVRGPWPALGFLLAALALTAWAGMRPAQTLRSIRALLLVVALLVAWHAWTNGWPRAVEAGCDLLSLVLAATVVTVTTPVDEMLDTLVAALGPFRRLGVRPERVALAFSLAIRAIPTTIEISRETHDAAAARGLQRDPRARLVPLVLRVVARARETGDALDARGLGDD